MSDIDPTAIEGMSVVPGDDEKPMHDPRQEAGQDKSIGRRLDKNPQSKDAQLDNALDESMDASDPPSNTQPAHDEPAPSSGFDAAAEANRQ